MQRQTYRLDLLGLLRQVWLQSISHRYDLGPVSRIELLHNVPDMHLDSAFAHAEFVSDNLVRLALT